MIAKSFIGECVELPRLYVSLDLAIPFASVKLSEPLPKLREFLSRESRDSLLEGFEFPHATYDTTLSFRGLTHLPSAAAPVRPAKEVVFVGLHLVQVIARKGMTRFVESLRGRKGAAGGQASVGRLVSRSPTSGVEKLGRPEAELRRRGYRQG